MAQSRAELATTGVDFFNKHGHCGMRVASRTAQAIKRSCLARAAEVELAHSKNNTASEQIKHCQPADEQAHFAAPSADALRAAYEASNFSKRAFFQIVGNTTGFTAKSYAHSGVCVQRLYRSKRVCVMGDSIAREAGDRSGRGAS